MQVAAKKQLICSFANITLPISSVQYPEFYDLNYLNILCNGPTFLSNEDFHSPRWRNWSIYFEHQITSSKGFDQTIFMMMNRASSPYSVLQSIKLSIHSKTDEAHIERSDASQVLLQKSVWIFFHNTYKCVALCFVVGWLQLVWFCCILDIMYFLNYYCFEFDSQFFNFFARQ